MLAQDEVFAIAEALVEARLAARRDLLFGGLPPMLEARIPRRRTPFEQCVSDVQELSDAFPLANGTVPLREFLRNAAALAGKLPQAIFFTSVAESPRAGVRRSVGADVAPELSRAAKTRSATSVGKFLRGPVGAFHALLAAHRDLAAGPEGDGWIFADTSLEGAATYRDEAGEVACALGRAHNATIGPLRLDVLRLATSALVTARDAGLRGLGALAVAEAAVGSYAEVRAGGATPPAPESMQRLITRVTERATEALFDASAPLNSTGRRAFVRGARYTDLGPERIDVPALLAAYASAFGERDARKVAAWKVEDAARYMAGLATLAQLRIRILARSRRGAHHLIELLEIHARPPGFPLSPAPDRWAHPAARVVAATRALLASAPHRLAAVSFAGRSFVAREIHAQEDALALDFMREQAEWEAFGHWIGGQLAAAHLRGVHALGTPAPAPWSEADAGGVLDRALELAGMLESMYLRWARQMRRSGSLD